MSLPRLFLYEMGKDERLLSIIRIVDTPETEPDAFFTRLWSPLEDLYSNPENKEVIEKIIQGLRTMADTMEVQLTIDDELEEFFGDGE